MDLSSGSGSKPLRDKGFRATQYAGSKSVAKPLDSPSCFAPYNVEH
jgi:hypothetical protein